MKNYITMEAHFGAQWTVWGSEQFRAPQVSCRLEVICAGVSKIENGVQPGPQKYTTLPNNQVLAKMLGDNLPSTFVCRFCDHFMGCSDPPFQNFTVLG